MTKQMIVNCSTSKLKDIRVFVSDTIGKYLPKKDKKMVILAVDEICTNLICHAKGEDGISIDIAMSNKTNSFEFVIKSKGEGFDYENYVEPNLKDIVAQRRKGGLGMILVRKIMDEVSFYQEDGVNVCELVKKSSIPFK